MTYIIIIYFIFFSFCISDDLLYYKFKNNEIDLIYESLDSAAVINFV